MLSNTRPELQPVHYGKTQRAHIFQRIKSGLSEKAATRRMLRPLIGAIRPRGEHNEGAGQGQEPTLFSCP